MGIKEWYKNTMEDDIARLDKRYFLLLLVSLTGILAAMERNKKAYKIAFIIADSLLIIDTLVELFVNLNKKEEE